MKDFKNKLLRLIDNGANQAKSLIESFNDVVDSFDMDEQFSFLNEKKEELIKRGNDLFCDFADLLKQVSDSITDFVVDVPIDKEAGEELSYTVEDSQLIVEVHYDDENTSKCNKMVVTIPENCDLERISIKYNKVLKMATITIPKIGSTQEDEEDHPLAEPNEEVEEADEQMGAADVNNSHTSETITHISSKLANKLRQNSAKYLNAMARNNGRRFVRRTPKVS